MAQTPDMSQLLRIASSPAGQQLIAQLRKTGGSELDTAVAKAASGDYTQAMRTLNTLLDNPEMKALLRQLEGSNG